MKYRIIQTKQKGKLRTQTGSFFINKHIPCQVSKTIPSPQYKRENSEKWFICEFAGSNDTLSFDKSYKLTNANNINTNGSLKTTDSNITLYVNYTKSFQTFNTGDTRLVKNVKDEILDKAFTEILEHGLN